MGDDDVTPRVPVARVENLYDKLEQYLSERAKFVFKNQRFELTRECYLYGRVVLGKEQVEHSIDFAVRINRLLSMFDGAHAYGYFGKVSYPLISSCLAVPVAVSLAPLGKRICRICKAEIVGVLCSGRGPSAHRSSFDVDIVGAQERRMYAAYLFVDGLPEEKLNKDVRLWLNEITKDFIVASREGEIPVNVEAAEG